MPIVIVAIIALVAVALIIEFLWAVIKLLLIAVGVLVAVILVITAIVWAVKNA